MEGFTRQVLLGMMALLLIGGMVACGGDGGDDSPPPEPSSPANTLPDVEVREYQGEKLGSLDDFRENSIKGPQQVPIDDYVLRVSGMVEAPLAYSYDQIIEGFDHYQKVVTLNCVEGWSVKVLWEGILVRELIRDAVPAAEADTIIFHAYDGYTTSLPVEYIVDNDILMAFKMNGVVLPPERGYPFQLVAESKWGYKWIKWITEIEFSDDEDYRGFWESRGYSNSGDLDKSFFD